ncbi:MgtC/SapB family protein [Peteryoungia desertarenae]|uniref:Protein MgtC n=1 Tax=Peteryoungia desertarenae TaxID=1813451 RepID=A0ABX6QIQ7_9HYPH|nr:MgtC/SapB family protein [Peteryoungia desertarenae]QLF68448.1 MgtC/SapB family protein [Peteryoungia desertarenae]
MDPVIDDFMHETYLPISVIALRLLIALICGAIVGFEREWHRRSAGLRTHILICLSAAALSIAAIEITHLSTFGSDEIRIDPLRIIESLTSGVAFLAAGTIVFSRGEVHGLTTGAGMWLAGSIGLAAGLGFWQVALLVTFFAMTVLWLLRRLEARFGLRSPDNEENSRD